jgi:hypothetical protein
MSNAHVFASIDSSAYTLLLSRQISMKFIEWTGCAHSKLLLAMNYITGRNAPFCICESNQEGKMHKKHKKVL